MGQNYKKSYMVVWGAIFSLLAYSHLNAQFGPCLGGVYRDTLIPTVAWQTYPCVKGGEYMEFTGIAGRMYTFTYCFAGGINFDDTQITILDGNGNDAGGYADDDCGLGSHVGYWFCPANGPYRVLTSSYYCTTGNICNVLAYKIEPDPTGPGNTCANSYLIPSLPFVASGFGTCGFGYDYSSANACGSQFMNDEDFVFRFNGTAGQCISIFTDNTYTYTGLFLVRGCPNVGGSTCLQAVESAGGNPFITNFTLPTTSTYYIIIDGEGTVFPDCTPFDIEVMNCVAVGQGANCATAFPIPSIPYSQNGFTTCGRGNTYTSAMACGSNYMNGDDFVFSYVSPGNECLSFDVSNTFSYTGVFVFDGCPSAGGTNCIASRGDPSGDPEIRQVNLVAPGTYYFMVSTWPSPQCTPFNLNITHCLPACGMNPNASDLCTSATPVSLAMGDTVCGTANFFFTPDVSVDLDNDFCGSIENNSWFGFVADSTQMTIRVDVPDCMSGFGLQVELFQTSDCNTFTPVSNCWNPQYQTSGVLQATGLTVGQTYYAMIDGYAGDDCEFLFIRIGNGPLPVTWGSISATPIGKTVQVDWSTTQEQNVRGFHIQRGFQETGGLDGLRWQNVGYVEGLGDTETGRSYSFDDIPPYDGATWYYRIQEVDIDGVSDFSEIVELQLSGPAISELRGVYPVPASSEVNIRYYAAAPGNVRLAIMDVQGRIVDQMDAEAVEVGTGMLTVNTSGYANGSYFFVLAIGKELIKHRFEVLQ